MTIFKCKMCGGDLEINQNMSVCECQYCGSKQTLPRLGDERKNNLYDRANHFRRNNEFDKAAAIYEQILNEEPEDAESYWSLVLCRYGIEYVEDPVTRKRVPTVNRAQYTSIFADEDYKAALKYADIEQKCIYEAEAKEIEQIQKGILEISNKEKPFDVFICYKESDAAGRRTPDSVLANDLYHQLTQEGFKVFFARITLEDKLGSAYEPYIFAALNSAKVMVVLGTKPEHFKAVWVRNEWSRYLALVKNGQKKILIPAYKDMDPYDLPEEFSHLQAQDMSKLGFMQDLIRGIKKITGQEEKSEQKVYQSAGVTNNAQALVKRAFIFLEDGEFEKAGEICEQALNQDPENANAYVAKLMIDRKVTTQKALSEGTEELTENNYFQKALRFAEDGLKSELTRCNQMIMDRNKDNAYEEILKMLKEDGVKGGIKATIGILDTAIGRYESLLGWRDSEEQIVNCKARKEELSNQLYQETKELLDKHPERKTDIKTLVKVMDEAIANYKSIEAFQDSKELLEVCLKKKERYTAKLTKTKLKKIGLIIVSACACMAAMFIYIQKMSERYEEEREEAYAMMENYAKAGEFDNAIDVMEKVGEKEEAQTYLYALAEEYVDAENYMAAGEIFEILADDKNAQDMQERILESKYKSAILLFDSGDYEGAKELFLELEKYSNSAEYLDLINITNWAEIKVITSGEAYELAEIDIGKVPKHVEIPTFITKITGEFAHSDLVSIIIPDGVTRIHGFYCCYSLESITLPDSITHIGGMCFMDCKALDNVILPDGLKSIGSQAFRNCDGLKSITIPASVEEIGSDAFEDCNSLTNVRILNDNLSGSGAFYNTPYHWNNWKTGY